MSSVRQRLIGRCFIPQRVLNAALIEADEKVPNETVGVLLGVSHGNDMWVDVVIGPGPGATHSPTTFVPDADFQADEIAIAYEALGRRTSYLGDWHTHPKASPAISWRDRRTLTAIAREGSARQPRPLMLILGYGDPWSATAWRYAGTTWWGGPHVVPMKLIVTEENGV